ncbi:MAG TPA: acylphosphatase [Chryseolinea sp.]|nr:acylphosphatase [Chryseolinea sp.]HPM29377.1 acylphosphatase [Chryseolinea sp.]
MIKHVSITVKGKVQGVFFRAATKEKADELGINGFVRNQPDQSVYIEAEGEDALLDELILWCKHGPPLAHVESSDSDEGPIKGFNEFLIQL